MLTEAQQLLEQACFDFAQRTMPETLALRGWDCAEAVELNVWMKLFSEHNWRLFKTSPFYDLLGHTSYQLLCEIRHAAVRRLPMTPDRLKECLREGAVLAVLLDINVPVVSRIIHMRHELQFFTSDMEDHRSILQAKLTKTRQRIAAERAELDRQEKEAIPEMVQADKFYQRHASASLARRLAASKSRRGSLR